MFRSIECDGHKPAEVVESIQTALDPRELLDRVGEHRVQQVRRRRVKHVADMIVARYLRQAEQALAVRAPVTLFDP